MEATVASVVLVCIYQTTWWNVP